MTWSHRATGLQHRLRQDPTGRWVLPALDTAAAGLSQWPAVRHPGALHAAFATDFAAAELLDLEPVRHLTDVPPADWTGDTVDVPSVRQLLDDVAAALRRAQPADTGALLAISQALLHVEEALHELADSGHGSWACPPS